MGCKVKNDNSNSEALTNTYYFAVLSFMFIKVSTVSRFFFVVESA